MKKIVFTIFCGWVLWTAFGAVGGRPLTASHLVAEQNGDQKRPTISRTMMRPFLDD